MDYECVPCPDNHFSGSLTAGACVPCPSNSGSHSPASFCQCTGGHARQRDGACTPCVPGTYRESLLTMAIEQETEKDYSMCEHCPQHMSLRSGSENAAECLCVAGYERQDATTCVLCSTDSFCPRLDAKVAYQPHSSSAAGAKSMEDCMCHAGYFLYDRACVLCGESFYCTRGVRTPCLANRTSAHGSTHADNCTCVTGFGTE